jgi:hypothetical protein
VNYQQIQVPKVTNAIEELAGTIQTLPADTRWLNAVPDVIQSRACGTPLKLGPRTRLAAMFLSVPMAPALARLLACAGSLLLLLNAYRSQSRAKPTTPLGSSIFIGVGALRERGLIEALARERSEEVSFLNETSLDSFSAVQRLGWRDLWREWLSVVRPAWRELGSEDPAVGLPPLNRQIEFLTQAHRYAYLRAWFRRLCTRFQVREPIVFSAASVVSFAAISVGMRSGYHLHGFQRRSLVYPDFEEVRCFTQVEAAHVARRLPSARVTVEVEPSNTIKTDRVVAIAGCYGQSLGLDECASFIAAARDNGIPVIIRPHPQDRSGFLERWRSDVNVTFCDTSKPFDEFLEQYRPRLLLSWFSTALFDALRRGVVPVTVETEAWRPLDTVFPFQAISLRWPQERARAFGLLANDADRQRFLAERRAIAGIQTGT